MAPTNANTPAAAAFHECLDRLFKEHKEAVAVEACEFEAGRVAVDLKAEVLKLDTGDAGTEISLERIADETAPPDFDISAVLIVDELETLVSTAYYVLCNGGVEVHVLYNGFTVEGFPLEMYSGLADDRVITAILGKLKRAAALFPDGLTAQPATDAAKPKSKRRGPSPGRRVIIDDK